MGLLYEYKCTLCNKRFEAYAPMTERDVPQTSPCCGATSRRVFAAPSAVHEELLDWDGPKRGPLLVHGLLAKGHLYVIRHR